MNPLSNGSVHAPVAPAAAPDTWLDMTVRGVRIEAQDIRSFELSRVGSALPPWTPGAHVQVRLPGGLTRAYSLCNHPGETDCYRVAVKLEAQSRGGSRAMHRLAPGDRIEVAAPRNLFELDASARRHVLIAGGIGITPLYAMHNALRESASHEMHYFSRSGAHAAFIDRMTDATLHAGLDAGETASALHAIASAHADAAHTTFYTCGPSAFMDAVETALAAAGIPARRLRSERFGGETDPAKLTTPAGAFRIVFARSGVEADVAYGQSIIAVVRAHGVDIPTSCEQGACGACLSDVIEGQAQHQDFYLSAKEQANGKVILPCVSRCEGSRLVIDR